LIRRPNSLFELSGKIGQKYNYFQQLAINDERHYFKTIGLIFSVAHICRKIAQFWPQKAAVSSNNPFLQKDWLSNSGYKSRQIWSH